jgi:uncharacterized radical SAM superfamily protein
MNTKLAAPEKLRKARDLSWERHGKRLTVFLPGMFSYNGLSGKYPAISITGSECTLQCDHCKGTILETMIDAKSSERLVEKALALAEKGNHGILISGGCDAEGHLPWNGHIRAIQEIKKRTPLYISIHCGLLDDPTALALKDAGVDQALIDVIGDDATFKRIYHVDFGISRIIETLESLQRSGIPTVPHIVCGLDSGRINGEKAAVDLIARFDVEQLVIVSLMAIPGTPFKGVKTPGPEEIADIVAEARLQMPDVRMSLGCARKRGDTRTEILALNAGINRMALPSEEALDHAGSLGLEISYQRTCCSVSKNLSKTSW